MRRVVHGHSAGAAVVRTVPVWPSTHWHGSQPTTTVPGPSARSFPDTSWPTLASRPADFGAHSAVSYRPPRRALRRRHRGIAEHLRHCAGCLERRAQHIGLILAAHASMAAGAVYERGAFSAAGSTPRQESAIFIDGGPAGVERPRRRTRSAHTPATVRIPPDSRP